MSSVDLFYDLLSDIVLVIELQFMSCAVLG